VNKFDINMCKTSHFS